LNDTRTPLEQATDGYNKAAFDVPYDRELEAMNYKQLSVALQQSAAGSARHSVIAHEMEKRKPPFSTKTHWSQRAVDILILGVFASLIASALWHFYGPQ